MIEQTAEACHRLAIAETEAQANFRHEAIVDSRAPEVKNFPAAFGPKKTPA